MLQRATFFLAFAATLSIGCSSPTGGGGGGGGHGGAGGGAYALGSLDEDCFGVSARDVLGAAAPSYTSTFTYNETEPNAGATAALTLAIHYAGGTLTCHPPTQSGPTGPDEGPHVTVDVAVTFDTDDGAFHEQLGGQLDGFDAASAVLSGNIAEADLGGTYDPNMPALHDVVVSVDGQVTPTATTGELLKGGAKSAQVSEVAFVGSW
jgi:hypothetical protein